MLQFDDKVTSLSALGSGSIVVITEKGDVYFLSTYWAYSTEEFIITKKQKLLCGEDIAPAVPLVVHKSCNFYAALTSNGKIYTWYGPVSDGDVHQKNHEQTAFFIDICPVYENSIVGLTLTGEAIKFNLGSGESHIRIDPNFGIPVAITEEYVLTSWGRLLFLTEEGYTAPIDHSVNFVAIYPMIKEALVVDEHGNTLDLVNSRLEKAAIQARMFNIPLRPPSPENCKLARIPPLVPSPLSFPVPWSVLFCHSVPNAVQKQVALLLACSYGDCMCSALSRELWYLVFFYL